MLLTFRSFLKYFNFFKSHYSRGEKGSLPNFDLTCFLPINKDDMA